MDSYIERNNNGTLVVPYRANQSRQLEAINGIYDTVYHHYKETSGFRIKYNGVGAYATYAISRDYMKSLFPTYGIIERGLSPYECLGEPYTLIDDITPTHIQSDIINSILSAMGREREWYVNLPTASGKTLLSVYLTSLMNMKTLIMCFSKGILKQWYETFKDKFTINPKRVTFIDSSAMLDAMYEGNFDFDRYDIYLCNPGILTKYLKKTDYNRLDTIFTRMGIGLKIFDEAHRHLSNIIKINAVSNVRFTLYLSADYGQGDPKKEEKFFKIFNKVRVISPKEEVLTDMKYTRGVVMLYDTHPDDLEAHQIFNGYGYSAQYYMDYQMKKGKIVDVIKQVVDYIHERDSSGRILILFNYIEHIEAVTSKLQEWYGDFFKVRSFHGLTDDSERDDIKKHADIIVSTYGSFGTGIHEKGIKYIIGTNQSNKVEDNQAAGRAEKPADGSDVIYFMLVDEGFPYCRKKLKTRLEYLKQKKLKGQVIKVMYRE